MTSCQLRSVPSDLTANFLRYYCDLTDSIKIAVHVFLWKLQKCIVRISLFSTVKPVNGLGDDIPSFFIVTYTEKPIKLQFIAMTLLPIAAIGFLRLGRRSAKD